MALDKNNCLKCRREDADLLQLRQKVLYELDLNVFKLQHLMDTCSGESPHGVLKSLSNALETAKLNSRERKAELTDIQLKCPIHCADCVDEREFHSFKISKTNT